MKGQGLDLAALRKRMDGALDVLRKELQGLRTGRADALGRDVLAVPRRVEARLR